MPEPERLHALDAVRAFALISGIVLHATLSFLPGTASMRWPIIDRSPSLSLEIAFYVIHVFRMSLFFAIAGFFAHLMYHRGGSAAFARNRTTRILVPLLVGYVILTPISIAVFFWAFVKSHGGAMPTRFHTPAQHSIPLGHLWFLYYLLLFYMLTIAGRAVLIGLIDKRAVLRSAVDRALRVMVMGYVAPLALAIPVAVSLYRQSGWVWFEIPTPDFGLTPQPVALVAFGTAFLFGWLLQRQMDLLTALARGWVIYVVLAIAMTVVAWRLIKSPLPFVSPVPSSVKLPYAAIYALAVWAWVLGIIGVAVRYCSKSSPTVRYVADSSYWMYLAHAPLILTLQTLVMYWPQTWIVKFPFIILISFSLLLLSYRYLVRFTIIGTVLNGRRRRPSTVPAVAPIANHGRDDLA
jgi:glucans biosynthesis protein C